MIARSTFKSVALEESDKKASDVIEVAIESEKVTAYTARVIENVTIAPSPQWLQTRS